MRRAKINILGNRATQARGGEGMGGVTAVKPRGKRKGGLALSDKGEFAASLFVGSLGRACCFSLVVEPRGPFETPYLQKKRSRSIYVRLLLLLA